MHMQEKKKERKDHTDLNQLSCLFYVNLQLHFHTFTTLFSKSAKTKTFKCDHITPMDEKLSFVRIFIHPIIHLSIHLFVIQTDI